MDAMAIMQGEHNAGFQGEIYTRAFNQFLKLAPTGMAQSRELHEKGNPQLPE